MPYNASTLTEHHRVTPEPAVGPASARSCSANIPGFHFVQPGLQTTNKKEAERRLSRAIFLCQNADYQLRACLLGTPAPLRRGEVKLAGAVNAMPSVMARTWEYGCARLAASGFWPPQSPGKRRTKQVPRKLVNR
jgi:hypothetical protein